MKKIKVCHLTSVHSAKDDRIFYKECVSLANAGYEVVLIAAGAENEICKNVKIIGVEKGKNRINRFFYTTKKVYRNALGIDADLYHIHDPELLPYALKLKKKGKKVIFDSHEFVGQQILIKNYIPKVLRKLLSKIYLAYEAKVCKSIDAVIQICTFDNENVFNGRSKKNVFITNYPLITHVPKQKHIYNDSAPLNLIYIGGLTRSRGIEVLANAVSKTNCYLTLAGPFESQELEESVKSILGSKLIYKGKLPLERIPDLLSTSDIGICTLLNEGQYAKIDTLATKIIEYMAASLPIIFSDFTYNKNFNAVYHIGWCVNPASEISISNLLMHLNQDRSQLKVIGDNNFKLFKNKFNWNSQEKKLLELYHNLLSNNE